MSDKFDSPEEALKALKTSLDVVEGHGKRLFKATNKAVKLGEQILKDYPDLEAAIIIVATKHEKLMTEFAKELS